MNQCRKGHSILKATCPECRKLKSDWASRLESSGFKDIENGQFFKDHGSIHDLNQRKDFQTTANFEAKASYYQWARDKLNAGMFASHRDRLIWDCHSEGLSRRKMENIVGLEGSWITRKLHKIEDYLKTNSIASMSCQLALF